MDEVIVKGMPEALRYFIVSDCGIPVSAFHIMSGSDLPQPANQLLNHPVDMTSTLAKYNRSKLYVDCLRRDISRRVYLREVFLKAQKDDAIVEYGVIAIVLDSFSEEQQKVIKAAKIPFGGLLHDFQIEFKSAPVCFFSISAESLKDTPFKDLKGQLFYGRFNQLSKSTGESIAWIMEILTPTDN